MNNKEIKKIQFGGWNKKPFKEIRKKIEIMSMEEELPDINRISKKKKKVCKFTKGEHQFIKTKELNFGTQFHWCWYECELCGKIKLT